MRKLTILESKDEEMLSIANESGDNIFIGNYWDFSVDGKSLKSLFEKMGYEVELKEEMFF
jgi:hypothetical protein